MQEQLNVSVYKCDFCKKKMFRKHAMAHHERYCESNPENAKACVGCIHLKEIKIEYSTGSNEYGSDERTAKGFKCIKHNQILYPTKVERKGFLEKYPETFEDQLPMPKECADFDNGYGFN